MDQNIQVLSNQIDYDVIFVGQLGAVVCNILLSHNCNAFKCLVINHCKQINQPALIPFKSQLVNITKFQPKFCDFDSQRIFKMLPEDNAILMENKKCYRYRFLIYTQDTSQWSNFLMIQNLQNALKTKYSFVYSNILKSQPHLSHSDIIFQQIKRGKNIEKRRISSFQNSRNKFHDRIAQNPDTQRIIGSCNINVMFYIPKPPHAGYDNINILYKLEQFMESFNKKLAKLRKQQQNQQLKAKSGNDKQILGKQQQKLNFILLVQGHNIFPMCKRIDSFIQQRIQQKGVKILKNHEIQRIDYLRRKVIINFTEQNSMENEVNFQVSISIKNKLVLNFDYLYVVIKQKVPSILQVSGINPFKNCPKTLMNTQFKNIFIFGADIFPTTHSFLAVNHQAHVIAQNIRNLLKFKIKKNYLCEIPLKQYNGYTSFTFWLSKNKYISLKHQYISLEEQQKSQIKGKISKIGQNVVIKEPMCCLSLIQSYRHRLIFNLQVSLFYNLKTYGAPYYMFVPQGSYQE